MLYELGVDQSLVLLPVCTIMPLETSADLKENTMANVTVSTAIRIVNGKVNKILRHGGILY